MKTAREAYSEQREQAEKDREQRAEEVATARQGGAVERAQNHTGKLGPVLLKHTPSDPVSEAASDVKAEAAEMRAKLQAALDALA